MATIKQQTKSKTIIFNTIVPALVVILKAYGIEVPQEVVLGIMAIGNYVLRLITKEPLENK